MKSLLIVLTLISSLGSMAQNRSLIQLGAGDSIRLETYDGPVRVMCRRGNGGGSTYRGPDFYLSLSDTDLFSAATYGIGDCKIAGSCLGCACSYYVKVNGRGYPGGTGCVDYRSEATSRVRQALRLGICI
jgi:hypothetical protein